VTPERGRLEFDLQSALARAAIAIEGFGSPLMTDCYRRMLELARESGDEAALFTALSGVWMEHNIAARVHEATESARQILEVAERRKIPGGIADALSFQEWTRFYGGHYDDALTKLNRAIAVCPECCMRRAVAIAAKQGAKSWELRATMSLARLLAKQGHRGEARAMLAEIYNWLTEGFDTADLIDAKALLDELSL
jgi:hypothetical protein